MLSANGTRRAAEHCLTADGLAVWYAPVPAQPAGSNPTERVPAEVLLWTGNQSTRLEGGEPRGLTCDEGRAHVLFAADLAP